MSDFKGYLKDKDGNKIYPDDYDTGWQTLALTSDFVSTGDSYIAAYRKIGNIVYLRGLIQRNGSSTGLKVATLPYSPSQPSYFSVATQLSEDSYENKAKAVSVVAPGELNLHFGNITGANWLSLSGVFYFVD